MRRRPRAGVPALVFIAGCWTRGMPSLGEGPGMGERVYVRIGLALAALVGFFLAAYLLRIGLDFLDKGMVTREFFGSQLFGYVVALFISEFFLNAFQISSYSKKPVVWTLRASLVLTLVTVASVPTGMVLGNKIFFSNDISFGWLLGSATFLLVMVLLWRWALRTTAWQMGTQGWSRIHKIVCLGISITCAPLWLFFLFSVAVVTH